MATDYPGAIDTFVNPISSDDLDSGTVPHHAQHADANDGIRAIQLELGTNPKGSFGSVRLRLEDLDTKFGGKVNSSLLNVANGVATTDASNKLVQTLDASKMNSGVLAAARIPQLASSKIDTASGAFADALIPNLAAVKITSGVFALSRIPGLPGNWITSGTIDAARLPSSVTANANMRVVADTTARDAIPTSERADGMLVWTRNPAGLFAWRADSSKWFMIMYRVVHNTATVIQTATNVFANVTGFSFPAEAGMTYGIKGNIFIDNPGNSSSKIRFGWSFPAGRMHSAQLGADTNTVSPAYNGTWTGHAVMDATSSPSDDATGLGTPAGIPLGAMLNATYECTTGGTVQLRFAQLVSAAQTSRLLRGSRMTVEGF